MDYFLKENKPYLMMAGGGFVFLLVYWMFVLSPLDAAADAAARELGAEQAALEVKMAAGVPSVETVELAERTVKQTSGQIARIAKESAFEVPKRFERPRSGRVKPYFENLNLDLYDELRKKLTQAKIVPPPGFGLQDETSEEAAPEMLLRLAVCERLMELAVAHKVERVGHVDALYRADRMDEPVTVEGVFLNKVSVFMRFSGSSESVFKLLHGVQKKGAFLSVESFEASRNDRTRDHLEASIGVSLLVVDPSRPITPPLEAEYEENY